MAQNIVKIFQVLIFFLSIFFLLYFFEILKFNSNYSKISYKLKINGKEDISLSSKYKKDWNDYKSLYFDLKREGFGEHGLPANLSNQADIERNKELFKTFGMSVVVSDQISVNRSVPDFRDERCLDKLYLKDLPQVSIIIIFHNEIFSVFKRTLHSLYNRTPHELIKEVILVNDKSTLDYLYEPLQIYIKENFPRLDFRILNLKEKHGAMKSRIAGAKIATGEILFVMEPHVELAYNWLPPLIDPLIGYPKRVTVPVIDTIEYNELKYYANHPSRGVFNWNLQYKLVQRFPVKKENELDPFETPIMNGGLYAIHRDYFFELGPYEEKTVLWGAEGIEMSLKIWLCGGEMFEVPCSRMGHMFRNFNLFRKHENVSDFEGFNQKILMEVWLEDYKKFVLRGNPTRYKNIDVGDLSEAKKFKIIHNCKPFKYFLDVVAPDLLETYSPTIIIFASGSIQLSNTSLCWEKLSEQKILLNPCDQNTKIPKSSQFFELTWYRDIRQSGFCVDAYMLSLNNCHESFGNQYFRYHQETKQLELRNKCVEANTKFNSITLNPCDTSNANQRWDWGVTNDTALQNFDILAKKLN